MNNDDRIAQWKLKRQEAAEAGALDRKLQKEAIAALQLNQQREETVRAIEVKENAVSAAVPDFHNSRLSSSVLAGLDRERANRGRMIKGITAASIIAAILYVIVFLTPLTTAETSLSIQRMGSIDSPVGGVLGIGGASNSDAYEIETLLESAAAMQELNNKTGYIDSFKEGTDPLTRPRRIALLGRDELSFYQDRISVSVNPQSGIITLLVEAKSSNKAIEASNALIEFATLYMSSRSERLIERQLFSYTERLSISRQRLDGLIEELTELKGAGANRDSTRDLPVRLQRVARLEAELSDVDSRLAALSEASVVSGARVNGLEGKQRSLRQELISARRESNKGDGSADIRIREAQVAEKQIAVDLAKENYTTALIAYDSLQQQIQAQRASLGIVTGPLPRAVPSTRRGVLHLIGLALSIMALLFLISIPLRALSLKRTGSFE